MNPCRDCKIYDRCPYAELPNKMECSYKTKDREEENISG